MRDEKHEGRPLVIGTIESENRMCPSRLSSVPADKTVQRSKYGCPTLQQRHTFLHVDVGRKILMIMQNIPAVQQEPAVSFLSYILFKSLFLVNSLIQINKRADAEAIFRI